MVLKFYRHADFYVSSIDKLIAVYIYDYACWYAQSTVANYHNAIQNTAAIT